MKPTKRVTGERRARLRKTVAQRYHEGANIREIAAATRRSYGGVRTLLVEAGVRLRLPGGSVRRDPADRAKWAAELKTKYEAGASIRDLATPGVVSVSTVRRLLHEAGTVMRPTGGDTRLLKGTT